MDYLIQPLLKLPEYRDILKHLQSYTRPVCITGPSDSQKAHLSYALGRQLKSGTVFVAYNEMQARRLYEDFTFFLGDSAVFLPSREIIMHDIEARSYDSVFQRLRALDRVIRGDYAVLCISAEAMAQKLIPPELFVQCTLKLRNGERLDSSRLNGTLVCLGYERVHAVEGMGQFAQRGGIIDIFPVNCENAVRIELFDDEIDSIRYFDTQSQRSVDKLEEVRIIPAREVIYPPERREEIIQSIRSEAKAVKRGGRGETGRGASQIENRAAADIDRFNTEYYFPGIDRYIPYIIDRPATAAEYAADAVLVTDEPVRAAQRVENLLLEHHETCRSLLEKGRILPGSQELYFDYIAIKNKTEGLRNVYLSTISSGIDPTECRTFNMPSKATGAYQGHIEFLCADLLNWKRDNASVIVLSGTRGRGERMAETLSGKGIEAPYTDSPQLVPGRIAITRGSLNKGFEYPTIGLVIVSDREVFGQERRARKAGGRLKGSRINIFTDLNAGDYVVHQAHGIGQYVGIEKLAVENVKRDYMKIRYQEGDFLYIPTNQLDLIQKYIGSEGRGPRVSKLGGSDWVRTKKRVKESLKELAGELIKLYARRQSLKGHAFRPDMVWQHQFEELFPYEETDDQLKCIQEIKKDMESDRVMDRLLCGDVGYGKTEVAIRAIFKAVMDGKQVAYLVPTTVLAQQHFMNFIERMKDFPVAVEVMSRFRSQSEQRRILKAVKNGGVDVLIGTHRLLQKDIAFKDLGLLIVDEEQRFGVSHKEKLKNLHPGVDVLTLTATPIPRTLHMSLTGIRDISVIEDPPEERYPVQTFVMEYNPEVIRDAMARELGRRGQVFYLYNRVRTIELKASEIQSTVPEARIAVAHGQMDEKQLEDIMLGFINGETDILVCTTIIESGLDMPNVNTIIVEDADRMGLSQLYQLRGRVGRSNRLAYAYITYKRDKVISEVAEKRLQAIKEFTELGSGFKIAMRDLEIRGAGNLLGPEQHGHMESVGYDMYCRLLDEAVRELRGEPAREADTEVTIDLAVSAYIDDAYIGVENQKIDMYKKIASIQDENDVLDITDELTDRYGEPPEPVMNLIAVAHIKALARETGFSSVTEKEDSIIFQLAGGKNISLEAIGRLADKYRRQLLFNAGTSPYLLYRIAGEGRGKLTDNIKILLQEIKSFVVKH